MMPRRKWAAAAILCLFVSLTAYFIIHRRPVPLAPAASHGQLVSKNDLSPGSDKAILTLADGSSIVLDSAHKGKIGSQGTTRILKLQGGELVYERQPAPTTDEALRYNMITTVRGGQYQVRLSDGSRVWLNAASSLRYPAAFQGDRSVELTGEAYFEIAAQYRTAANGKSEKIPFTVMVNGARVEVLGTHFNINAYNDEPSIKTTLLEGAVNIRAGTSSVSMKPGEETTIDNTGAVRRSTAVNVEDAVAWKNGLFQFRSADIQTIMRQVSRWYDVDVTFEKNIPEKFYAELPRNTSASALFKILETTGAVHFVIDGRKVKVLP